MENATKALLMAGGILVAVLGLALIVNMYNSSSDLFRTQEGIVETEQLTEFNKQYESYNKKLLRGVEVISVFNKAIDNNKKYKDMILGSQEADYTIEIKCTIKNALGQNEEIDIATYEGTIKPDNEKFTEFKRKVFDCTGINYNSKGRVREMNFKEREVKNDS